MQKTGSIARLFGYAKFARFSSTSPKADLKVNKDLLSKLRKDTGYPFSKCHDALRASSNEMTGALEWLEEMSQKEGWKKAEKLKGRLTGQGLIGAIVQDNVAALVEVNCETDFVARNEVFKNLVAQAAASALKFKQKVIKQNQLVNSLSFDDIAHLREIIPTHDLEDIKLDEECLKDSIISVINQLGENIVLNRAVTIATSKHHVIGAYAHGNTSGSVEGCLYGKYASLVVLGTEVQLQDGGIKSLAAGIAQHVVGMRPEAIDKNPNDKDADMALLNQEYLLDDNVSVRTLLQKHQAKVVDFVNYQCGR